MNDLPCEVVRDLLPSYVDGLTCEMTNRLVDAHMECCEPCRAALDAMRAPEAEPERESDGGTKEIDYLKKNRRHNRKVLLGSLFGALALVILALFLSMCVVGEELSGQAALCDVQIDGNLLTVDLETLDSARVVKGITFAEEDGVVTLSARTVLVSLLHRENASAVFSASQPIRQVRMGERIFWDDGLTISDLVSRLYATRHDYVGDMPANGRTANALNLQSWLGAYENELLTAQRPYVWILRLQDAVPSRQAELKERAMERFACAMLALVGNLDEVRFEYRTEDDASLVKRVTAQDASALAGRDIKECGGSPRMLAEMMDAVGLSLDGMSRLQIADLTEQGVTSLEVVNHSHDTLLSVTVSAYRDGELCSTQTGQNADNSPMDDGFAMLFQFVPSDFHGRDYENAELTVKVSVTTADGAEHEASGELRLAPRFGASLCVFLEGSAAEGFRIGQ